MLVFLSLRSPCNTEKKGWANLRICLRLHSRCTINNFLIWKLSPYMEVKSVSIARVIQTPAF